MAKKATTPAPAVPVVEEPATPKAPEKVVFSKAKILKLNRYAKRRDYLTAVLVDGENYTLDQVDDLISKLEKKGKVK